MSETKSVDFIHAMFKAWNDHDGDRFVSMLDDSTVWESDIFPQPFRGRQGARQFIQAYLRAFPDLRLDIEQTIASGNHVVVRWRFTGTHRGEMMGIPPSGKRVDVHGCVVHEVSDGKHRHAWVYYDNATLLRQIGVMPAAA